MRLRALELRHRLARVELDEGVAGLHLGAVLDEDFFDRGVEMRAQRDAGDRLGGADLVDAPGQVLALGGRDDDRNRRARRSGGRRRRRCRRRARQRGRQQDVDLPRQGSRRGKHLLDRVRGVARVKRQNSGDRRKEAGEATKAH